MSYRYRYEKDGRTTNCFPVDEDDTIWVESSGKTILDLIELAKEKWPDVPFEDISIDAVHHHQYNIYYDLHDSSDYVNYFVLEYSK